MLITLTYEMKKVLTSYIWSEGPWTKNVFPTIRFGEEKEQEMRGVKMERAPQLVSGLANLVKHTYISNIIADTFYSPNFHHGAEEESR